MTHKEIYEILLQNYGSIITVAEKSGVYRNSVRNILLGITSRGKKAGEVRENAEAEALRILAEKQERLGKILAKKQELNNIEALLANATN